jgi:hypothetical protein
VLVQSKVLRRVPSNSACSKMQPLLKNVTHRKRHTVIQILCICCRSIDRERHGVVGREKARGGGTAFNSNKEAAPGGARQGRARERQRGCRKQWEQ